MLVMGFGGSEKDLHNASFCQCLLMARLWPHWLCWSCGRGWLPPPVTTRWWGGRLRSGDEDFLLQPCSGNKYWQLDIANVCTGSQRCIAFLPGVIMTARFSGACVLQPFQPRHCTIKSKWQSHGTRGSSSVPRRTFSWDVDGAARTLSESARGGFSCLSHWWPCRAWWKRSSRAQLRLFTIQR